MSDQDMSDQHLVVLLRLVEEGYNAGRFDRLEEIFHPEVVAHGPIPIDPGVEGLRAALMRVKQAFPESHIDIVDFAETPDTIYRRWIFHGTNSGSFFGMPPTGRSVDMTGVDIERFDGDRIIEHWSIWDRATMMEQLGLIPALEPPPDA
jgi:steroid delta-isomerase-like uncharacterized protein